MGENQEKQRKLEQAVDEYAERQSSYHAYTEDEVFSYNGEENERQLQHKIITAELCTDRVQIM